MIPETITGQGRATDSAPNIIASVFFLILLIGVTVIASFIFLPFLSAIILAGVVAILFHRTYQRLLWLFSPSMASLLVCIAVLILVIVPMIVIGAVAWRELSALATLLFSGGGDLFDRILLNGDQYAVNLTGMSLNDFLRELTGNVRSISQNVGTIVRGVYESVTGIVLWVIAFLFSLFYLLIDGERAVRFLMRLSPLRNTYEQRLARDVVSMSRATIKGNFIVSIVQGALGGLLFAAVGLPSPVLWGVVMAFVSLLPMVGAGLVWTPAGVILLLTGALWQGLTVLLFGTFVISLIDNYLRPKLVGNDTQMHPLLVFFATLGGIFAYGPLGFIIGPIIVAICLALWEIYAMEFRAQIRAAHR